jgi:DNA polymerase-3 subunit beta
MNYLLLNNKQQPTYSSNDFSTRMSEGVNTTMKIVCDKEELFKGVQIVSRAVPNNTTMSLLECILITAKDNNISMLANDMELGIETYIEGTIIEEGIIALDAKILLEIIRKLPDNIVTIFTDGEYKTTILCEKAKFTIIGKSGEDFSYLPKVDKNDRIAITQFALKEAIRQTIFSISDADKLMSGELFEINGDIMRLASLDGHRISIRRVILKDNYPDEKVIVPGKTLIEVSKILSLDVDEGIIIYFSNKHIIFELEKTTIVSRLIDGDYFRIDQMFSNDYETKFKINKKELLNCIERASLLVKEGDKKPIIFNITEGKMDILIRSALGSLNEEIEIDKTGKDIMIGFNPKFLIDVLRSIDEENVNVYMMNPKAPCIIKDEKESYLYLILPINFNTV